MSSTEPPAGEERFAAGDAQFVSTGALPDGRRIDELLDEALRRFRPEQAGVVADYIPALAAADPGLFGLSVAEAAGGRHSVGDALEPFSIQSISKAFVFALVCQELGSRRAAELVGVDNTGLPFDSVTAIELNDGSPMNPMVNAGALATTALVPGATSAAKWKAVQDGLSAFAGRPLHLDIPVYESEASTNLRNQSIARLLESYGRLAFDPLATTDVYTKQCSLAVTTEDLAVMGATLADGGVNPVTGRRVVDADVCQHVLAAMATSGLYERSGTWLYDIGLPGKSGVSGGILTIAPGKGGLATFSPPLDTAGNSVRGVLATTWLSRTLGLNLFASSDLHHSETP
ncbi:glutaminase A [Curtobacterium sp. PhB115]|uniref:glutaminase A n=1 Tax=Curtobacterium sp. PhB115 TaxID=2485173 RepID=UPI000F4C12D0|nr:glutaminase A [Curtobacterium sp. PhB115]ROP65418.1 L-glutaminase [Curtobacterium sp. PhB115]